jgi:hypothetical protein
LVYSSDEDRREKRKAYMLAWKAKQPPETPEQRAHRIERTRKWRLSKLADPIWVEKERQRQNALRAAMPSEVKRQKMRRFKESNPTYFREYSQAVLKTPEGALKNRLRTRMYGALHGKQRASTTMGLTGCSKEQLRNHIESLFLPGMTWENRSEWHIDHIRPCASFDLLDAAQQRCCFHYTNLQPLWKSDNLKKSDKWEAANGI